MGLPVHGRSKTSDAVGDPVFEAMLVLEIKENTANDQNEQVSCPFCIIALLGEILRSNPAHRDTAHLDPKIAKLKIAPI